MLPKINTARYTLKLPSSGTDIEYRPFLVGEEKILLAVVEGNNSETINALKTVITNCTFGAFNIDDLPIIDLEYIFVQLRIKSKGEIAEVIYECSECKKDVPTAVDLTKITVTKSDTNNIIKIGDNIGMVLQYPTTKMFDLMTTVDGSMSFDLMLKIVKQSIVSIYNGDEVFYIKDIDSEELDEFMNSLSSDQFEQVKQFFESQPKISQSINILCRHCNHEEHTEISGIRSFLG